ncbi:MULTISPECIES: HAD family hydrolase [unclassified Kitasatospora]|uniref:HAD family hydrolase n=1 Tax=unclassified Kitasatospora TaxID=2633591 RepID=UPI0033FF597E
MISIPHVERFPCLAEPSPGIDPRHIDAVALDTDGVLTDSQQLRIAAWGDALHAFTAQYARATGHPWPVPTTSSGLITHLLGLLDEDIAASLLRPAGHPVDLAADHLGPAEADLRQLLACQVDQRLAELLHSRGPSARPGARALLLRLRAAGIATAAISTSRRAGEMLRHAGLGDLIDVSIDGQDAKHYRLAGPPHPGLLQLALRLLHARPDRAALLADTAVVLEAGRLGALGLVVAVDHRDTERAQLVGRHTPLVHGLDAIEVSPQRSTPVRT